MSDEDTGKIVTFDLDVDNLPPMTGEQREQTERLREMKDQDIDFSDIPRQTGLDKWNRQGLFGGPVGRLRNGGFEGESAAIG